MPRPFAYPCETYRKDKKEPEQMLRLFWFIFLIAYRWRPLVSAFTLRSIFTI